MKDIGIVGLPFSGKTTLFNALTRAGVPAGGAAGRANLAAVAAAADLVLELTMADLASVAGGADKAGRRARAGVKEAALEAGVLTRARDLLDQGTPLRAATWQPEELKVLRNFAPLTLKPLLAVVNLGEEEAAEAAGRAAAVEQALGMPAVALPGALEAEAAELPPEDAAAYLREVGVERSGLDQVVAAAWRLLDLLTFLTTGEDETRAWEVRRGATAPEAAGRIHSDLERGFIRAEVIPYDDVVAAGGWDAARAKGLLRSEGRSYVVKEGDVLHVRFNV
jgi:ribosome-binding ATPase